jgi:hypothetical protein
VLEYADVAGAELLRAYCLAVAACNLDAVLLEAGGAFEQLPPHLLAELERLFRGRLAGAGGGAGAAAAAVGPAERRDAESQAEAADADVVAMVRRNLRPPRLGSVLQAGRRPTAAAARLGDDDGDVETAAGCGAGWPLLPPAPGPSSFRDRSQSVAEAAAQRLLRTLHKKLQQIEQLEARAAAGAPLDPQQAAKVLQRPVIQSAAAALEGGAAVADVHAILRAATAGREGEAGASAGAAPASAGKGGAAAAAAAAPPSGGKAGRSRGKKGAARAAGAAAEGGADAAAEHGEGLADGGSSLLGCSPPSSSLVPAFGAAGSAAAAAEQQPPTSTAAQQPSAPALQVRSQVGFAASAATDGVAATAARSPGQLGGQQAGEAAAAGAAKPRSASKRKGGCSPATAFGCFACFGCLRPLSLPSPPLATSSC